MKYYALLFTMILITSCSKDGEEVIAQPEIDVFEPLMVTIDWNDTFEYQGFPYTYCATMDIDVYVYNEQGKEATNFEAARANCPEAFQLDDGFENGSFQVFLNAYNLSDLSQFGIEPLEVPVSINFSRAGKEHLTVIDTISTNDSIWQRRDQKDVFIEVGTITKSDEGFEWLELGKERVVF